MRPNPHLVERLLDVDYVGGPHGLEGEVDAGLLQLGAGVGSLLEGGEGWRGGGVGRDKGLQFKPDVYRLSLIPPTAPHQAPPTAPSSGRTAATAPPLAGSRRLPPGTALVLGVGVGVGGEE